MEYCTPALRNVQSRHLIPGKKCVNHRPIDGGGGDTPEPGPLPKFWLGVVLITQCSANNVKFKPYVTYCTYCEFHQK